MLSLFDEVFKSMICLTREKSKVTSHRNQTIDLLTTLASGELKRPYHLGFCKVKLQQIGPLLNTLSQISLKVILSHSIDKSSNVSNPFHFLSISKFQKNSSSGNGNAISIFTIIYLVRE